MVNLEALHDYFCTDANNVDERRKKTHLIGNGEYKPLNPSDSRSCRRLHHEIGIHNQELMALCHSLQALQAESRNPYHY